MVYFDALLKNNSFISYVEQHIYIISDIMFLLMVSHLMLFHVPVFDTTMIVTLLRAVSLLCPLASIPHKKWVLHIWLYGISGWNRL